MTWDELEQKKTETYAIVEGLGFKSDFKIFGKHLNCDVGPQGDLNLLVQKHDDSETNNESQYLIELETRLSKELNCDVRAYTHTTLESRLRPKVTSEHLQEIKKHVTHTLEDIVLGNTFVRIFQEDRWSSFRTSDGRVFTRSDFLEQQDLTKIFDFLLGSNFSFEQVKDILNSQEKLQEVIQKKLSLYNSSSREHGPTLGKILTIFSLVVPLYETGFQFIYIPVERREGKIHYNYFCPFGQVTTGEYLTIGDLPPRWSSNEFKKLDPSMQALYSPRELGDGSQVWIKCDEIFKESLNNIQKGAKISESISNDIVNLLYNKNNSILEALSPQNIINEKNIFRATTVDYVYTQKELEDRRENTKIFRKKRLEETEHLQKIIKKTSLEYYKALEKELSSHSQHLKKTILQYILLDKKIENLLRLIYSKNEIDFTFLWQIMDYKQMSAFAYFIDHANLKQISLKTQYTTNSFSHFKINIKNKLSSIKDSKIRSEITEMLEQQKKNIQDMVPELIKTVFPLSWQSGMQVDTRGGIGRIQFDRPRVVKNISIPVSYFTEEEAHKLVNKYTAMFFPIRDPKIVECFLVGSNPIEAIYFDFWDRYCQIEEPSTTFTINEGKETLTMVDFSSEIEYLNHKRKQSIKQKLETLASIKPNKKPNRRGIKHQLHSLQEPLKVLVNAGKGKGLTQNQATLSGFAGTARTIYGHIASMHTFGQRKLMIPTLLVEEMPHFIGQNTSSGIKIGLGSRSESKTMFSNNIEDLNHLMTVYGWSEDDKRSYKIKNNFNEDNEIIKAYFHFDRLKKDLSSARLRESEYKKKLEDLQEKLLIHSEKYTPLQKEKLASNIEIYTHALEENLKYQHVLTKNILEHPYLERRISEVLQDPDFLEGLRQKNLSNIEIKELINKKSEELKAKALEEVNTLRG